MDNRVNTACTDGRRIFVSEEWYAALPEVQRLAVLAHEVLHIALRHFYRIGSRDRKRFNYASDVEIHFILETEGFQEPIVLPAQDEWANLSAEEIYDLLPKELPEEPQEHLYPDDDRSAGLGDQADDGIHGNNAETGGCDANVDNGDPAASDSLSGKEEDGDKDEENAGSESESDPEFKPHFGEEIVKDWRETLVQTQMMSGASGPGHGTVPAGLQRYIDKLLNPK